MFACLSVLLFNIFFSTLPLGSLKTSIGKQRWSKLKDFFFFLYSNRNVNRNWYSYMHFYSFPCIYPSYILINTSSISLSNWEYSLRILTHHILFRVREGELTSRDGRVAAFEVTHGHRREGYVAPDGQVTEAGEDHEACLSGRIWSVIVTENVTVTVVLCCGYCHESDF